METQVQQQVDNTPPSPTFLTLVLKTLAGFGGGIVGMIILLVIFLGASTVLQPSFNPEVAGDAGKSPLFIFVFMAMIFLTSMGANLLGSLFFTFVDHERYSRSSTAMYQIFFINLIIFALLAPIYILLDTRGLLQMTAFLAGFHVVISSLASMMVLEVIGNVKYALVGIYGVIFSLVISTSTILTIHQFTAQNPVIVLFASVPVIWTTLGFVTVLTEMFYHWLWTLYGTDFLASQTSFGMDYGETEEEEAPPPPDVEGADFLKK